MLNFKVNSGLLLQTRLESVDHSAIFVDFSKPFWPLKQIDYRGNYTEIIGFIRIIAIPCTFCTVLSLSREHKRFFLTQILPIEVKYYKVLSFPHGIRHHHIDVIICSNRHTMGSEPQFQV